MKVSKKICIVFGSIFLLIFLTQIASFYMSTQGLGTETPPILVPAAEGYNQTEIDDLLDGRLGDYSQYGGFQEFYEPSLRDTYFALYVLDSLGKLDQINATATRQYVIDQYNASSNEFQDDYSLRFYELTNSEADYQNSPLLTYCYAVLALDILDQLGTIDQDDVKNFMWSCFDSSSGGFFGYPNPTSSPQNLATAENTYHAVKILNRMSVDWGFYASEKNDIVDFLNDLQYQNPLMTMYYGGFKNDLDEGVETVMSWDPNLRSCYFAIMALNDIGAIGTFNGGAFFDYLDMLYDSNTNCFFYNYFETISRKYNVFSTALGIDLADLLGYTYDQTDAISFLLNQRASMGGWYNSETINNYELIDTFEVIRSFNESDRMFYFDGYDKDEICQFVLGFQQNNSFSTLSRNHTSMRTISTTVSAFDLNDRIFDLDIQGLYDVISTAYIYYDFGGPLGEGSWYGLANTDYSRINYRTAPLEYKSTVNYDFSSNIAQLDSNEHVFYALSALEKIFKLDDFASENNLTELMEHIVGCQFLEEGYDTEGGFIPNYGYTLYAPSLQDKYVHVQYAYFATKCIEIIDSYIDDGDITDNGVDISAIGYFLNQRWQFESQYEYFLPDHSSNPSDILESTYFMVYVLKAFDIFDLNTNKIINYASSIVDYTNFRDLYNLWRLSRALNYSYDFDINAARTLIRDLFLEEEGEYLESHSALIPNTNALFWICDIAENDEVRIIYDVDNPITLGEYFAINATLCNLLLDDFGAYATVKFESTELGVIVLDKDGDLYSENIFVPLNSEYEDGIVAHLCVYMGAKKIKEVEFLIDTVNPQGEPEPPNNSGDDNSTDNSNQTDGDNPEPPPIPDEGPIFNSAIEAIPALSVIFIASIACTMTSVSIKRKHKSDNIVGKKKVIGEKGDGHKVKNSEGDGHTKVINL